MGKDLQGKVLPDGITQRKTGIYRGRFKYNGETYTRDNADLKELVRELEYYRHPESFLYYNPDWPYAGIVVLRQAV